ncbi:DNA-binding transcriptional regulator, LysR family [Parafrankia irregularis]|uniref:DNA-binding transcriptional regulator, LysR family n=1 Tax=Parafrankia irregularis TaxID=795642 RepID=A0A0S4QUA8_9ACTN|nr:MULTISPECIES: LysR family transcriptional regulator [Parafrankia]MBE3199868.1 LysR family transcriptional regulator [Parafrankia sp. CH37]CUU58022.1 DNA-binding transcriptional regulator, LysR family [Parafrankia irregularis]
MGRTLDIAPLRSFVAVADCGGFQRAASALHLSQAAVSQHVRRLEAATGRILVERQGRGSRLTRDGEHLLRQARRILRLHDETLHSFVPQAAEPVIIGSTEHAAAQLLPPLNGVLEQELPDQVMRFRIDRGNRLREGLDTGQVDLALLLGPADDPRAWPVGQLELTWYSAPTWERPSLSQPVPLVVFDQPCSLRNRALEALSFHAIPTVIGAEAVQLAGVQAAVRAGLGVGLMATLGQTPEGLVARDDLPQPAPLPIALWARQSLPTEISRRVAEALCQLLLAPADLAPSDLPPAPLAAPVDAHLEPSTSKGV